ncbi:unnamed protein product, partial [Urochloa humidicola]
PSLNLRSRWGAGAGGVCPGYGTCDSGDLKRAELMPTAPRAAPASWHGRRRAGQCGSPALREERSSTAPLGQCPVEVLLWGLAGGRSREEMGHGWHRASVRQREEVLGQARMEARADAAPATSHSGRMPGIAERCSCWCDGGIYSSGK